MTPRVKRYVLAITGASGSIYGTTLLAELLRAGHEVHFVASEAGRSVLGHETGFSLPADAGKAREALGAFLEVPIAALHVHGERDLFAPIASGSFRLDGMVVIPCSMKTLAGIAHGSSGNLIERAADVALKERWPLVVVPRESPLSEIHLTNMLAAARVGVRVVPAMPGFYQHPESVEDLVRFVVARALDALDLPQSLLPPWRGDAA